LEFREWCDDAFDRRDVLDLREDRFGELRLECAESLSNSLRAPSSSFRDCLTLLDSREFLWMLIFFWVFGLARKKTKWTGLFFLDAFN
jgi:hypothetical protein